VLASTRNHHPGIRWLFVLAAAGYALSLPAIHNSCVLIWSTTAQTLVLAVILRSLFDQGWRNRSWSGLAVTGGGLAAGAAILLSPTLLVPVLVHVAVYHGRRPRRLLAVLAVAALPLAAWMGRNYACFDRFVFVKSSFGHELFVGNNPVSDGRYRRYYRMALDAYGPDNPLVQPVANEIEHEERLRRAAFAWIGENPLAFASLTLRRFFLFWGASMVAIPFAPAQLAYRGVEWLYLLAVLVGAIVAWRHHRPVLWLALGYQLPYMITHCDMTRYRIPILPVGFFLMGLGLLWVLRKLLSRRSDASFSPPSHL
jgi:hypothetical protein